MLDLARSLHLIRPRDSAQIILIHYLRTVVINTELSERSAYPADFAHALRQ